MQFGDKVFHRRHVERARRDEQNEIRLDGTVFRHDRRAFDDGQNIPLHALAGNVRAAAVALARDLIDLVDEHDTVVFRTPDRLRFDRVLVHELVGLLRDRDLERLFHRKFTFLFLLREHIPEDTAD